MFSRKKWPYRALPAFGSVLGMWVVLAITSGNPGRTIAAATAPSDGPEESLSVMISGFTTRPLTVSVPGACKSEFYRLKSALDTYQLESYWGRKDSDRKSDAAFAEIQAALEAAQLKSGKCFERISGFYALGSFLELNSIADVLHQDVLVRFANELLKAETFKPLTVPIRNSLGDEWTQVSRSGHGYSVMGAYDCEQSKIWFDSTLRPYDLGAVVLHEMEHLSRDKVLYRDGAFIQQSDDIYGLLLMDETVSSMHAAYAQLRLRKDLNRPDDFSTGNPRRLDLSAGFPGLRRKMIPRLTISRDLSLYSRGGNLEEAWMKIAKDHGLPRFASFAYFFDLLLSQEQYRPYFLGILDLVSKVYFENTPPKTQATLNRIRAWSENDALRLSPLVHFQASVSGEIDAPIFTEIEGIISGLKTKTEGCALLSEAIRHGKGQGYFGNEGSRPGDGNSLPGNEGSRPGDGNSLPGNEGSRPGDGNSRPGNEGSRPSESVMPCLKPDKPL